MTNKGFLNVAVIVPVLNGGCVWIEAAKALRRQRFTPSQILVVDSGSTDASVQVAQEAGFRVERIDKRDFDHGGTRQRAAESLDGADIVIFLTQDAVLATPNALGALVSVFRDPSVGVAYGRQLPRQGAGVLEAHARSFNYPAASHVRRFDDRHRFGIKAAFVSNSFAAYRLSALMQVGGFPTKLILSEDMVVTARMLMAGWAAAYVAESRVLHSHGYTILQEFQRYFDIGVLHSDQHWILDEFGRPEGEGIRFLRSEIYFVLRHAPWLLPVLAMHAFTKYAGYRAGLAHRHLSVEWRRRLGMNKRYWDSLPIRRGAKSGV